MPRYARIDADLSIVRYAVDDNMAIAQHKVHSDGGLFWRPVEEDANPPYVFGLETVKVETIVEVNRVHIKKTVEALPSQDQIGAIKAQASERILKAYPSWKQANMTARQGELLRIVLGEMLDANGDLVTARALTVDEKAELMAINVSWDWIKKIRVRSNELEAMSPLPADYSSDSRWIV